MCQGRVPPVLQHHLLGHVSEGIIYLFDVVHSAEVVREGATLPLAQNTHTPRQIRVPILGGDFGALQIVVDRTF